MPTFLLTTLPIFAPRNRSAGMQLLVSFGLISIIIFLKIWIPDIGRYSPYLLFSTAIIVTGWYAGMVASLTTAVLASLLVSFIFITPFGVLNEQPVSSVAAGLFLIESFSLSFFIEYTKKLRELALQQKQLVSALEEFTPLYAIICLNSENIIVGWSKGAEKIFGYKEEEIKGKRISHICDKRNWYDIKSNPLRVRVQTKIIYSTDHKEGYRVKILSLVPEKKPLYTPEEIQTSSSIPSEIMPAAQIG